MLSLARAKSRSLESANEAKTGEQSVFGEIHTNHELGMPQGTLQHRKLDSQTRYVAASAVTDRQTDKPTTVTLAHAPRVNKLLQVGGLPQEVCVVATLG